MARTKLPSNCSEIFKRYTKIGVISDIEKEFSKRPSTRVSLSLIDDNRFIKRADISPVVVENFTEAVSNKGVFVPLLLRKNGSRYELVCGRKRLYAAKRLKYWDVPAWVIDVDDEEALLMILADIRDQKDSNIVEFAYVFQTLFEDYSYPQADIATISHQSRSQVTNTMRLLKLPLSIIQMVSRGDLSYGHARTIEPLDEKSQFLAVSLIKDEQLSVRDTEVLVKRLQENPSALEKPVDDILKEKFDATYVHVHKNNVLFSFDNEEERNAFIERLKKI
ncbi:MAG: ParB/RepB/Spo0J family partition protein [Bacilli bacterium]|nr:ParB/RepB/Spo0J family partition protein [Bacilli bacterium]